MFAFGGAFHQFTVKQQLQKSVKQTAKKVAIGITLDKKKQMRHRSQRRLFHSNLFKALSNTHLDKWVFFQVASHTHYLLFVSRLIAIRDKHRSKIVFTQRVYSVVMVLEACCLFLDVCLDVILTINNLFSEFLQDLKLVKILRRISNL